MPIGPARMPLFDHLGELRRRLTIVVVSVLSASLVLYFATPTVIDILQDPIREFADEFYVMTALGGFIIAYVVGLALVYGGTVMLILLTVLAFNLMGDGLRDALDPKLKQ